MSVDLYVTSLLSLRPHKLITDGVSLSGTFQSAITLFTVQSDTLE